MRKKYDSSMDRLQDTCRIHRVSNTQAVRLVRSLQEGVTFESAVAIVERLVRTTDVVFCRYCDKPLPTKQAKSVHETVQHRRPCRKGQAA